MVDIIKDGEKLRELVQEVMPLLSNFVAGRRYSPPKGMLKKAFQLNESLLVYKGADKSAILATKIHGNNLGGWLTSKVGFGATSLNGALERMDSVFFEDMPDMEAKDMSSSKRKAEHLVDDKESKRRKAVKDVPQREGEWKGPRLPEGGRSKVPKLEVIDEAAEIEEPAAVKMQKIARGYLGRKEAVTKSAEQAVAKWVDEGGPKPSEALGTVSVNYLEKMFLKAADKGTVKLLPLAESMNLDVVGKGGLAERTKTRLGDAGKASVVSFLDNWKEAAAKAKREAKYQRSLTHGR